MTLISTIVITSTGNATPMELRCLYCHRLLLKVSENTRGVIEKKCERCSGMNRFDLNGNLP